jgi:hypothetical protein
MKLLNLSKFLLLLGIFFTKPFDFGYHFLGLDRSSEFLGFIVRFADLALFIVIAAFLLFKFSSQNETPVVLSEAKNLDASLTLNSTKNYRNLVLSLSVVCLIFYWFLTNLNTFYSFKTGILTFTAFLISTVLCLKYKPKWLLVLIPYSCFDHILLSSTVSASIFLYLSLQAKWTSKEQILSNFNKSRSQYYFSFSLFFITLANLILAIYQVKTGHSLGLSWLGEPILDLKNTDGIAKQILPFSNQIVLRGYGLMPHPNILGFLGVLGLLTSFKLPKRLQITSKIEDLQNNNLNIVSIHNIVNIILNVLLIIVSMSRMALISLVLILVLKIFSNFSLNSLKYLQNITKTKVLSFVTLFSIFIFTFTFFSLNTRQNSDLYRLNQHQTLVDFIQKEPQSLLFGVGPGQFSQHLKMVKITNLEWENEPFYQPFGNILVELGVFGITVSVVLAINMYKKEGFETL